VAGSGSCARNGRFMWRAQLESCHAESVVLEAKLATREESVFWNLAALALQEYGYSPSKLEWDERSQIYNLRVNQLGVPHSERVVTLFKGQFSASVANGRLHEAVMRNLLDAVGRAIPGAA